MISYLPFLYNMANNGVAYRQANYFENYVICQHTLRIVFNCYFQSDERKYDIIVLRENKLISINSTYNNINFKEFHYDRLMVNSNSFIEFRTAIFA